MAEIRYFPGSALRSVRQNVVPKFAPEEFPAVSGEKYCVYNQARERFVATDVEAVDPLTCSPDSRLRTLGRRDGAALWIVPFWEPSPTSVRFPLDLIYLNDNCIVLDTVESFPLASAAASSTRAASMLALPSETVALGGIRAGDRLIISSPEEMKRHLQRLKDAKADSQCNAQPFLGQFAVPPTKEKSGGVVEESVQCVVGPDPAASIEVEPAEIAAAEVPGTEEQAPSPQVVTYPWKKEPESRNWLTRLLLGDHPVDPRKTQRESLPGLIAYFFTGGTPEGHEVRDFSLTGIYIVTSERWYPGTVVQVTLTDRHQPSIVRSLTVHARAVRSGGDGVGLEFVLEAKKRRRCKAYELPEQTNGVDMAQVEEFLRNFRAAPQQK
ncbi:MAG: PilZ domain-containing protein [Terracidiphilus sp.]